MSVKSGSIIDMIISEGQPRKNTAWVLISLKIGIRGGEDTEPMIYPYADGFLT